MRGSLRHPRFPVPTLPHPLPSRGASVAAGGGAAWMALSALAFSVMTLLARTLAGRLPGEQIILARTVITLVVTLAMLRAARVTPVLGRHHRLLLLRGAAGFVALDFLFYAVARLPLAEATVLQYLNPVLVTLLAAVFLGERITRGAVAALSTCVAGVLLVARPAVLFGGAASALDPLAVAAAVAGAAMSSVAYLSIRAIGRREHPLVVVLYLPLVSLPTSLAFTLGSYVAPTAMEWATLAGIGIATQVGQVALTNGVATRGGRTRDDGRLPANRLRRALGRSLPRRDPERLEPRRGAPHRRRRRGGVAGRRAARHRERGDARGAALAAVGPSVARAAAGRGAGPHGTAQEPERQRCGAGW